MPCGVSKFCPEMTILLSPALKIVSETLFIEGSSVTCNWNPGSFLCEELFVTKSQRVPALSPPKDTSNWIDVSDQVSIDWLTFVAVV